MTNPANYRRVGLLVLTVLGWACDGDARDGTPLEIEKFVLDECKQRAIGELLTGRETSDYEGLECVAWDFRSGDAAIDLINRPEGCGFSGHDDETLWSPAVKQLSASQIEFEVQWNFSDPDACGGCLHDFSVRLADVELEKRVRIDVATRSCTQGCSWSRDSLRAAEPSGIRCRYVDDGGFHDDEWGTIRLRPRNGVCDGELVASELPDGKTRCLSRCESDDDCPLGELESCAEGTCQLRDPW